MRDEYLPEICSGIRFLSPETRLHLLDLVTRSEPLAREEFLLPSSKTPMRLGDYLVQNCFTGSDMLKLFGDDFKNFNQALLLLRRLDLAKSVSSQTMLLVEKTLLGFALYHTAPERFSTMLEEPEFASSMIAIFKMVKDARMSTLSISSNLLKCALSLKDDTNGLRLITTLHSILSPSHAPLAGSSQIAFFTTQLASIVAVRPNGTSLESQISKISMLFESVPAGVHFIGTDNRIMLRKFLDRSCADLPRLRISSLGDWLSIAQKIDYLPIKAAPLICRSLFLRRSSSNHILKECVVSSNERFISLLPNAVLFKLLLRPELHSNPMFLQVANGRIFTEKGISGSYSHQRRCFLSNAAAQNPFHLSAKDYLSSLLTGLSTFSTLSCASSNPDESIRKTRLTQTILALMWWAYAVEDCTDLVACGVKELISKKLTQQMLLTRHDVTRWNTLRRAKPILEGRALLNREEGVHQ